METTVQDFEQAARPHAAAAHEEASHDRILFWPCISRQLCKADRDARPMHEEQLENRSVGTHRQHCIMLTACSTPYGCPSIEFGGMQCPLLLDASTLLALGYAAAGA